MTTAGSWSVSEIINTYPELKAKIGVAVMPTFDGNQNVTTATNGGWVYVISSDCKHPEKAAEVLKYLVAGEDTTKTEEYFEKAYYSKASPRKSVQQKIETSLANQTTVPAEWISIINEVSSKGVLEPIYSWDISVQIELFLEKCAYADDASQNVASLKEADDAIKDLIASNGYTDGKSNPRKK